MDGTFGTGRFFGAKPAAFEAEPGILEQVMALDAHFVTIPVHALAIESDHCLNCFPFPREAGRGEGIGVFPHALLNRVCQRRLDGVYSHAHDLIMTQIDGNGFDLNQVCTNSLSKDDSGCYSFVATTDALAYIHSAR